MVVDVKSLRRKRLNLVNGTLCEDHHIVRVVKNRLISVCRFLWSLCGFIMAYEYDVPHVDFVKEFNGNDGADSFFDIHEHLEKKLTLNSETVGDETSVHATNILHATTCNEHFKRNEKHNSVPTSSDDIIFKSSEADVCCNSASTAGCKDSITSGSPEKQTVTSIDETPDNDILIQNGTCSPVCCYGDQDLCVQESGVSSTNATVFKPRQLYSKSKETCSAVLKEITGNIQNVRDTRKRKSDSDNRVVKFISLAQGVRDFQVNFRKAGATGKKNLVNKCHVTIPQSPHLLCKTRTRPVDYPTVEERTQKELEEIQSFKLKANPVNRKIFETPQLGRKVSRAPLVVEPFNLTEYKKKEVKATDSPFLFKAHPIPKGMLEHPIGVPEKKKLPITNPHTPSFVKSKIKFQTIEEVDGKLSISEKPASHISIPPNVHPGKTLPCPFSFEERDKMMIKHKEEKIKKILEEEKEARNFLAKPIPSFVKKCSNLSKGSPTSVKSSPRSMKDEEKFVPFKAQPPVVLHKEPFKPKLPEHSFTHPDNFVLHTEQRALSRKEYDEHLKERADCIEAELQRRQELQEKRELEEVARLRQQAVHRAQPVRRYKPIPEKQTITITSPATPKFSERFKK